MEEKEPGESEPVDLRCAEQAELLSLIISGEEEATQEESDLGGKEKTSVVILGVSTRVCLCVAVRATAIVRQPVNPCQGQCRGAAWPLRLCGSYKQRLNSTQAGRRAETRGRHLADSGGTGRLMP